MNITNGKTAAFGGGIRASNTSTTVIDCIIIGNQAGTGGGISAVFGALTLNPTTVTGNTAALGAGSSPVVINDFSGDRRSHFVQRTAHSQWLIVNSAKGATQTQQWG